MHVLADQASVELIYVHIFFLDLTFYVMLEFRTLSRIVVIEFWR